MVKPFVTGNNQPLCNEYPFLYCEFALSKETPGLNLHFASPSLEQPNFTQFKAFNQSKRR